jgi:hypothetical protein
MSGEPKSWDQLSTEMRRIPTPPYATGPWNGRYLAPYTWRTDRITIEPLAPRITELDYAAYMSSMAHVQLSYGTGDFPSPDITLDQASLDTHECWNHFGRGTAFLFAALTPDRDEEVGCAYLVPTAEGGPREASLQLWVVERQLRFDLDQHLLETMLNWIRREWDFARVLHVVPQRYERGKRIALAAGLQPVSRSDQDENYACFAWAAPS